MGARLAEVEPAGRGSSDRRPESIRQSSTRPSNPLRTAFGGRPDADRLLALGNTGLRRLVERGLGPSHSADERDADSLAAHVDDPGNAGRLAGIRIHTSRRAAGAAAAVNARAFTVGHDVFFGAGEYVPGSEQSDQLLAHELGHVLQDQGSGERVLRRQEARGTAAAARELGEMWDAIKWAASESPGSFFALGFVTPYGQRGGFRGMLRTPADTQREMMIRNANRPRR